MIGCDMGSRLTTQASSAQCSMLQSLWLNRAAVGKGDAQPEQPKGGGPQICTDSQILATRLGVQENQKRPNQNCSRESRIAQQTQAARISAAAKEQERRREHQ